MKKAQIAILISLLLLSFCFTVEAVKQEGKKVPKEKKESQKVKEPSASDSIDSLSTEPIIQEEIKAKPQKNDAQSQEKVEISEENSKDKPNKPQKEQKPVKPAKQPKVQKIEEEITSAETIKEKKPKIPSQEKENEIKIEETTGAESVQVNSKQEKERKLEKPPKQPKEEKIPKEKTPKAPKEPKAPKVEIPRNITQEVVNKAAKHTFWNQTDSITYLTTHKFAGLKKNNCFTNEQQTFKGVETTSAINLCAQVSYNPVHENQWVEWTGNNTQTGKYRFWNNGTSCEQQFNWILEQSNGTESQTREQGSYFVQNSVETGLIFECQISGNAISNQTSKEWSSSSKYTMKIAGSVRGEVFNKTTRVHSVLGSNHTETSTSSQLIQDTIALETNSNSINGQNVTLYKKSDNKTNSFSSFNIKTLNSNKTESSQISTTSKVLVDSVSVSNEGKTYLSETNKVKQETTSVLVDGVQVRNSGIEANRSRSYSQQDFGLQATHIQYSDNGSDRKWKINQVRPDKNIDIPNNWNVNGTYVPEVSQGTVKSEKNKGSNSEKRIDL